ncbi:olichyl-diphosphooligosaccharide--protein glycotransferase OST4 Ecym_6453 [Eremothecium cymbalariae DBVPG|uniref:Dolichyl-diphosphooligosaccharide--protein glycosyltransferase subunit OST4 n=1 Tax=Eremothecium cymbalariae (strain CBS 270.75 / DBVPG 7215 / KCTC 17166 / NRRL Y-17582) TaxID=931890 RepID=G8JUP4_ERECY|nr:hypothetical protein Ecym_6453 [Eremothecium cymbalariae DBVPG\
MITDNQLNTLAISFGLVMFTFIVFYYIIDFAVKKKEDIKRE